MAHGHDGMTTKALRELLLNLSTNYESLLIANLPDEMVNPCKVTNCSFHNLECVQQA